VRIYGNEIKALSGIQITCWKKVWVKTALLAPLNKCFWRISQKKYQANVDSLYISTNGQMLDAKARFPAACPKYWVTSDP